MKSITLACALAAAALGVASVSHAQGWDRGGRGQEGRRGGWEQGRGAPQQDERAGQRGQRAAQERQQPAQVQPAPSRNWEQQRQWPGPRRDGAGAPPPQNVPQYPPQRQYPRYAVPSQGYVQPAPPAHYGPPVRSNGYVQSQPPATAPQWQNQNPQWPNQQWQNQNPQWQNRERDGRRAERGAWRQAPRFRRGDYLPPEYRHHYVQDWRAHRLYAPPPGYQWVQVDTGDYLLIAITTGVIANLLLGQ